MASYLELRTLFSDTGLRNKVSVAAIVAAETIKNELDTTPNHANRLIWAKQAFANPIAISDTLLMALLAANKDATVATIQGATDATIQTAVDNIIDLIADGS